MNQYNHQNQIVATSIEPKPVREVPQEIGRLHFEIEQLEGAVSRLVSQMEHVIRPISVKKDQVAKEAAPTTKMAGEIQMLSQRIRNVQETINNLTEGVQL